MTVDDVYLTLMYCANKFLNGNALTPDEFNRIINVGQWSFMDWILGQFQDYQMGRPSSRVEFGINMTVRESLTKLIGPMVTLSVDATGAVQWPSDYQRWDVLLTLDYKKIRPVQQHRFDSFFNSTIDPPYKVITNYKGESVTQINPIWLLEDDLFRIYPNTNENSYSLGSIRASYIRTPSTIKWASINDPVTGLPVYDPTKSVDPDWFETDWWEIAARAGKQIGLNLESQQLMGYFDDIIRNGN